MKRVALALSMILLAACELSVDVPIDASTDVDGGGSVGSECEVNPCENGGTCTVTSNGFSCKCAPGYEGDLCDTNVDDCSPNPCKNDGVCSDRVAGYTCACASGFTGVDCSTNIDECVDEPCQNGGTCTDKVDSFQCDCPAGYTGSSCEVNVDDCSPNPCQNGGTCADGVNGFTCTCTDGNSGPTCSNHVETCGADTCQHGGTCTDGADGFTCECLAGYNGVNCETDVNDCESSPCQNGGTCVDKVAGYTCECAAGYEGVNCENDTDPCRGDPCQNGATCQGAGDYYTCSCLPGYSGADCQLNIDDCSSIPCQHGGQCMDEVNGFSCDCTGTGYTGVTCNNDEQNCPTDNPCQNGGTCTDLTNGYKCTCAAGYSGQLCETDVNDCAADPCLHGTCVDKVNGYECNCDAGYVGPRCQTDFNECDAAPCQNGGTCTDMVNGFKCDCMPGWGGDDCSIDINDCANDPCQNGGLCIDGLNSYSCQCADGYTGDHCETPVNDCPLIGVCGHGTCDGSDNCVCDPGWSGSICDMDVDECAADPDLCLHGGTCSNLSGDFSCACSDGYTGKLCDACDDGYDYDELAGTCCMHGYAGATCSECAPGFSLINDVCQLTCAAAPPGFCSGHGQCDDSNGPAVCTCDSGYFGDSCERLGGDCSSSLCGDNGSCVDYGDSTYFCECVSGWTGVTCAEPDDCAVNPCAHGTCVDGDNSYTCLCPPGWTGADCSDVNECTIHTTNPCMNGGVCEDGADMYSCTCAAGWQGLDCDIVDECLPDNPCANGGVCTDGPDTGDYSCACAPGYDGPNCADCATGYEDVSGECRVTCATTSLDCGGHGTCDDASKTAAPSCACDMGWAGDLCDQCDAGYEDVSGECRVTCTSTTMPCGGHGTCDDASKTAAPTCTCEMGWAGDTCAQCDVGYENVGGACTVTCATAGLACGAHGSCDDMSKTSPPVCVCDTGWSGDACAGCDTGFEDVGGDCRETCLSTGLSCGVHGSCDDMTKTAPPACACAPGWAGDTCTECATGYEDVAGECRATCVSTAFSCGAHGSCDDMMKTAAPTCACDTGWTGDTCTACDTNYEDVGGDCRETCLSTGLSCGAHGSCDDMMKMAAPSCACDTGWTGDTCTACDANYENVGGDCRATCASTGLSCGAHGSCDDMMQTAPAACACDTGWTGPACDACATGYENVGGDCLETCASTTTLDCGAHGVCDDMTKTVTAYCVCDTGWDGASCGVCASTYEDVGGDCVQTCNSTQLNCGVYGACNDNSQTTPPTCDCTDGYAGTPCEDIDECTLDPMACGNGVCTNVGAGFNCQCPAGTMDLSGRGTDCQNVSFVAAGLQNTCAITTAGTLHCWGNPDNGQVGPGPYPAMTEVRTPRRIGNGSGWTTVSVGATHSCGVRSGHLFCWGENSHSKVKFGEPMLVTSPVDILPELTWADVAVGDTHSCALTAGNALYCWGDSASYQAGAQPSGNTDVEAPQQVAGSWTAIAAGGSHTCAINTADTLYCWGANARGQVGDTSTTDVATPFAHTGTWASVSAGALHTCATQIAGATYCWGAGDLGALAQGATYTDALAPVAVTGSPSYTSLATGTAFTCGWNASTGFTPDCWGTNEDNLLIASDPPPSLFDVPTALGGSMTWSGFAVGETHSCGIESVTSDLYCWGSNDQGEVGTAVPGMTALAPAPVLAPVVPHSTNPCVGDPCKNGGACTAAGNSFTCDCTGTGFSGATCTDGVDECTNNPTICGQGTCANLLDGDGYTCTCPDGTLDVDGTGTTCESATQLVGAIYNTCAIATGGSLHCWGNNVHGELGANDLGWVHIYDPATAQTVITPTRVIDDGLPGTGWTQVAVGEMHVCGLRGTDLYCWGSNYYGQLGASDIPMATDGELGVATLPHQVPGTWSKVSTYSTHTCAIESGTDKLFCWGSGTFGTGESADTATPTEPLIGGNPTTWRDVAAGVAFTCGISTANDLYCWGTESVLEQFGDGAGTPMNPTPTPQPVDLTNVSPAPDATNGPLWTNVFVSQQHACATLDTKLYCWGRGNFGAMGVGSGPATSYPAPVAVPVPMGVSGALTDVFVGRSLTCGVDGAANATTANLYCTGWERWNRNLLPEDSIVRVYTQQVVGTTHWNVVPSGSYGTVCGVDTAGDIYCWGYNQYGQTGHTAPQTEGGSLAILNYSGLAKVKARPAEHPAVAP